MVNYAELQVTTNFSFLRGASHPEELFAQAAALGVSALGVVDWNSVAGIVRAWEASKATGVRLVAGARLALTAVHGMEKRGGKLAIATMCVGVGQGVAVAIEKLN